MTIQGVLKCSGNIVWEGRPDFHGGIAKIVEQFMGVIIIAPGLHHTHKPLIEHISHGIYWLMSYRRPDGRITIPGKRRDKAGVCPDSINHAFN